MIMKKLHLILIMYFAFCIMHCLNAQDKTVILFENFENGIPSTWVQEQIIGDYNWVVESGDLKNPEGTTSGSKRIAFRNNTNQTTGYVTRLILPEMNLAKIFQPILCLSYAQEKWAGDFDTLKIKYRRTPNSNWVTLKTYDTYASGWHRDTIRLAAVTSTYQLAFEAIDNLGRGVVLDDIEVRSIPNCTQPFNLAVGKITGTSAAVEWAGSFDALNYNVKISNKPLSERQLLGIESTDAETRDFLVDGAEYSLEIADLKPATEYYFYVQSVCVGENSDWSEGCQFRTSDMIILPYYETFNMDYIENTTSSVENWFTYSSKSRAVPPFVNTHQTKSYRLKYSPDSTTALFFQGALNTETAIGAKGYAYACVPEIYIDSIKRLQLSFWTINYVTDGLVPMGEACKILVGVMTDPSNKKTFVPVDTIEITSVADFEEVFVSFENYEGDGKYITFMSEFAVTNAFVIDNLLIEEIPTTPKANIKVALPQSEALEVEFLEEKSLQYEVMVSNVLLKTSNIDNKKVVAREIFNSENCRIEGLYPWVNYYVYGRHINDGDTGAWSNPVPVLMPEKFYNSPTTITFDINTFDLATFYNPGKSTYKLANGLLTLSNNSVFPESTEQYWGKESRSQWELHMEVRNKPDWQLIIFPEMINPKQTKVSFYATRHLAVPATFAVGIMSDANDPASFQPLDLITIEDITKRNYKSYSYDLSAYNFEGRFFAIRFAHEYINQVLKPTEFPQVWIDDVRFYENSSCSEPFELESEVDGDEATISWKNNGASSWNVVVTTTEYSADEIDNLTPDKYFAKQTTQTNSITISGLNTAKKTYYYYVQSNCEGELSIWTLPASFTTECLAVENIPYTMDFDDSEWIVDASRKGFSVPCLFTKQTEFTDNSIDVTYYYPHLSNTIKFTGEKSLVLGYSSYIAFPEFNAAITDLQIAFSMIADSLSHAVEVGVMTDPNDPETFVKVADVEVETIKVSQKFFISFSSYQGEGRYIAFRSNMAKTVQLYVDNIYIDFVSECAEVTNVEVSELTNSSAVLTWANGNKETKWNIKVYQDSIDTTAVAFFDGEVNTKPFTLTGLKPLTNYYVFVQAKTDNCVGNWSQMLEFRTPCPDIFEVPYKVNFNKYGKDDIPDCWIVKAGTSSNTLPRVYDGSDCYDYDTGTKEGGRVFRMYSGKNGYSYAILPEVNEPINNLQISLILSLLTSFAVTIITQSFGNSKVDIFLYSNNSINFNCSSLLIESIKSITNTL